ncbi:MAG: hypothetical protein IT367_11515 [Candidatus Hydrogenedentes bacterium]|nr:hypothetical protein [Candidatus Hydrogenedentota bacterium]
MRSRGSFMRRIVALALGVPSNRVSMRPDDILSVCIAVTAKQVHMNHYLLSVTLAFTSIAAGPDNTTFQSYAPYSPELDIASDTAIVYGVGETFAQRAAEWRAKGYDVSLMTGIAWGEYGSYYGEGDAFKKNEVQTERSGKLRMHGDSTNVGYNVPTPAYIEFIKRYIDPAIDAGVRAVYLEEPEYWANTGWSEAFKQEWKRFYGEPWQVPDSSPDAQYRASKLKYELYFNALREVFAHVDNRGKEKGESIDCIVPTHSLVNYSQWRIVSPEAHLVDIPQLDGYVAQVWTGTARSRNSYLGVAKERTFETAYLEYGQMLAMTRPTGKKLWFLHDPVEDNPNRSWNDYRYNYECTVVASLMWPEVHRFEVMPWPDRIFRGQYAKTDMETKSGDRASIPEDYATEILAIINALNDMKQADVTYEAGSRGIGVVISDTAMFQRAEPTPSDPMLGSFYGLALPLLKAGVPIEVVQLENVGYPDALSRYKVLLLTYENQKPLKPAYHEALAAWVREGGCLLLVDDGRDPYHTVREWWNEQGATSAKAADHLMRTLGVDGKVWDSSVAVGKGHVRCIAASPAKLTYEKDGADKVRAWVKELLALQGEELKMAPGICIRRGPYVVASVFDESPLPDNSMTIRGQFADLFDPQLPVISDKVLMPNQRTLLYDIGGLRTRSEGPRVVAASTRIRDVKVNNESIQFTTRGPASTVARMRVYLPRAPKVVVIAPESEIATTWDAASSTMLLETRNRAEDTGITITY